MYLCVDFQHAGHVGGSGVFLLIGSHYGVLSEFEISTLHVRV